MVEVLSEANLQRQATARTVIAETLAALAMPEVVDTLGPRAQELADVASRVVVPNIVEGKAVVPDDWRDRDNIVPLLVVSEEELAATALQKLYAPLTRLPYRQFVVADTPPRYSLIHGGFVRLTDLVTARYEAPCRKAPQDTPIVNASTWSQYEVEWADEASGQMGLLAFLPFIVYVTGRARPSTLSHELVHLWEVRRHTKDGTLPIRMSLEGRLHSEVNARTVGAVVALALDPSEHIPEFEEYMRLTALQRTHTNPGCPEQITAEFLIAAARERHMILHPGELERLQHRVDAAQ